MCKGWGSSGSFHPLAAALVMAMKAVRIWVKVLNKRMKEYLILLLMRIQLTAVSLLQIFNEMQH
jgi:hypothetical protein